MALALPGSNGLVLKKLREADPRAGFVTREQFDAIAKHLPVEVQVGALIAFAFGWRKREVKTKNREGRVAHLTPELRAVLSAQVGAGPGTLCGQRRAVAAPVARSLFLDVAHAHPQALPEPVPVALSRVSATARSGSR